MGFLSKLNPLNAPGMKPLKKLAGKSPVLNKLPGLGSKGPAKTRTPTAKPAPIGPSPAVVDKAAQAAPAMSAPPQMSPPPQMTPSPMQAPMQEAPEPVMGAQEMQMQPPPMMAPPQMMPPQQMGMPAGATPQFDPSSLMQKLQQGNTGVMGGRNGPIARRPSGIGPRFMS